MGETSPSASLAHKIKNCIEDISLLIARRTSQSAFGWKQPADDVPFKVFQIARIWFVLCHPKLFILDDDFCTAKSSARHLFSLIGLFGQALKPLQHFPERGHVAREGISSRVPDRHGAVKRSASQDGHQFLGLPVSPGGQGGFPEEGAVIQVELRDRALQGSFGINFQEGFLSHGRKVGRIEGQRNR